MSVNIALLYAGVPKIACKGKCQSSCGPVNGEASEREYFVSGTHKPFPDALKILQNHIRKGAPLDCPYLNPLGQCDVYQFRPLVCRLWGVVPSMPCPYGCVPERILTEDEARELMLAAR